MPENETDWLSLCRDREELLGLLQKNERPRLVAEIGVYEGDFSEQILRYCKEATVYIIDPWQFQPGYRDGCNHEQAKFDDIYMRCMERFKPYGDRAVILRQFSTEAADEFADECLDMAYIDGDHCYNSCKADIAAWWPKVRPGGILAGHDYTPGNPDIVGVIPAVQEFVQQYNLQLFNLNRAADCSWAVRKP
jgi:hypothetical protein